MFTSSDLPRLIKPVEGSRERPLSQASLCEYVVILLRMAEDFEDPVRQILINSAGALDLLWNKRHAEALTQQAHQEI